MGLLTAVWVGIRVDVVMLVEVGLGVWEAVIVNVSVGEEICVIVAVGGSVVALGTGVWLAMMAGKVAVGTSCKEFWIMIPMMIDTPRSPIRIRAPMMICLRRRVGAGLEMTG